MRLKFVFAGAAVAVTAIAPVTASAYTVFYDNIGAATNGTDNAASFGPLYDSFSTGATAPTITQLDLLLTGASGDGDTFQVQILTDGGGPGLGTVLYASGHIGDNVLSATPNDLNLSFAPVVLSASNRYWVELIGDDGSSVAWAWSFDVSGTGVANESFANANGTHPNNPDGPYQMRVTDEPAVSAAPLPAALPLFTTGLGALGLLGWCRKRKAQAAA